MFVDASLRGLPDKVESAYGQIVFLGDGFQPGKHSIAMPLDWSNGKLIELSQVHMKQKR